MTDNFENKVAVDGPVVNEGELGSSTFSPGQVSPAGPLGLGQRWTVTRKREVALRLLRGEPVELLSRQLGVEIFRLEQWREKAIAGIATRPNVHEDVRPPEVSWNCPPLNRSQTGYSVVGDLGRNTLGWVRPGSEDTVLSVTCEVLEAGDEIVILLSGDPVYRTSITSPRYDSEFDEAIRERLIDHLHAAVTNQE